MFLQFKTVNRRQLALGAVAIGTVIGAAGIVVAIATGDLLWFVIALLLVSIEATSFSVMIQRIGLDKAVVSTR